MNLPTYHKEIKIILADRDFQGFVEEEGEAYIEGQVLHTHIRFNPISLPFLTCTMPNSILMEQNTYA